MKITNFTYKIESLAAETGLIYRLSSRYYRGIIEREIILANITENDNILCIGGGICPFSAILFHRITGARVTVTDNNAECVSKAQAVINRLGIGKNVRVFCADGADSNVDFSEYTVVHLALQVSPLDLVFARVAQKIAPGTRLMIRKPKKFLAGMYCTGTLPEHCPCTIHKSRSIGSTLLYTA
ncbi:MAG: hypothetical protein FWC70_09075 [Defluviitaleaceae bacterium]|nr:hypothetical protein [Defluviitaleaceae bacterium]